MEFFEFANVLTTQEEIRNKVSIDTLPFYCEEVEAVDAAEELGRVIYFRHWEIPGTAYLIPGSA